LSWLAKRRVARTKDPPEKSRGARKIRSTRTWQTVIL
jgi:hypothetical protein